MSEGPMSDPSLVPDAPNSERPLLRGARVRRFVSVSLALCAIASLVALPRMERRRTSTVQGVELDARTRAALARFEGAIADYRAEHGRFPGFPPAPHGTFTVPSAGLDGTASIEWLGVQLLGRTDEAGRPDPNGAFGPYLGAPPVNPSTGTTSVRVLNPGVPPTGAREVGWVYDPRSGAVYATRGEG